MRDKGRRKSAVWKVVQVPDRRRPPFLLIVQSRVPLPLARLTAPRAAVRPLSPRPRHRNPL